MELFVCDFYLFFPPPAPGFTAWRVVPWDGSMHALIITLAEIPLLTCRVVLSQHQCRGDSRQTFHGWIHGRLLAEL